MRNFLGMNGRIGERVRGRNEEKEMTIKKKRIPV
jgi:hypothetical protein